MSHLWNVQNVVDVQKQRKSDSLDTLYIGVTSGVCVHHLRKHSPHTYAQQQGTPRWFLSSVDLYLSRSSQDFLGQSQLTNSSLFIGSGSMFIPVREEDHFHTGLGTGVQSGAKWANCTSSAHSSINTMSFKRKLNANAIMPNKAAPFTSMNSHNINTFWLCVFFSLILHFHYILPWVALKLITYIQGIHRELIQHASPANITLILS